MGVFEKELELLNESQRKAVEEIYGPVLVLAGPGSGKTKVLTLRIANILKKTDADPKNILALTFTETAAFNMKQRLIDIIGKEAYELKISTFHGFANEVILENPEIFSFKKDLIQISDLGRYKIARKIIDNGNFEVLKPFGNTYMYVDDILSSISILKKEGISAKDFQKIIENEESLLEDMKERNKRKKKYFKEEKNIKKQKELNIFYEAYNETLLNEGFYDYDDMMNFVVEEFEKRSDLLLDYQERFQFILVDEFQDTNGGQMNLLYKISSYDESPNLFVVGDDDQAIFRFQGASNLNIRSFEEKFRGNLKVFVLDKNYRSGKKIVEKSNLLISENKDRVSDFLGIKKELKSNLSIEGEIKIYEFETDLDEAAFVSEKILDLVSNGVKKSEIAVLARRASDLDLVSQVLRNKGIGFYNSSSLNILKSPLIKKIISLVKFIAKPSLFDETFVLLSSELFGLSSFESYKIVSNFDLIHESLMKFFDGSLGKENLDKVLSDLSTEKSPGIEKFFKIIQKRKEYIDMSPSELLVSLLDDLGIVGKLIKDEKIHEMEDLTSLFLFLKRRETEESWYSIFSFLEDLEFLESKESKVIIKKDVATEVEDLVILSTIHSAKGLEFENVFMIASLEDRFSESARKSRINLPRLISAKYLSGDSSSDERRVFYVGMTRAKKRLFISSFKKAIDSETKEDKLISRFALDLKEPVKEKHLSIKEKFASIFTLPEKETITEQEKIVLEEKIKKLSINPTSLNTFIFCPRKFKYEFLYNIPQKRDKHLILGAAIHRALENFFSKMKEGVTPNLEFLVSALSESLKKESLKKDECEKIFSEGEKIITNYYKKYKEEFKVPLFLEYNFSFKEIFFDGIRLSGRIDKIELLGSGKEVKVVDYKTSDPLSENQILGKNSDSPSDEFRQLVFYKLLLSLDKSFFYTPKIFEIDYLRPNRSGNFVKVSFEIKEDEVKNLKELIKKTYDSIKTLYFPKKEKDKKCEGCRFFGVCWE